MTEIKYPARMKQLVDFDGLCKVGKITPTDIDGMIEFQGRGYLFYELKYELAEVPLGQRIALERLVQDTSVKEKRCVAIIAQHCVEDVNEPVKIECAVVREVYLSDKKRWVEPTELTTVGDYTEKLLAYLSRRK